MNIQTCVSKKPSTYKAIQITKDITCQEANSLNKVKRIEEPDSENRFYIQVENPLGLQRADLGDWLVQLPSGMYYIYTNEEFEKQYVVEG